jgi:hypothetical protein
MFMGNYSVTARKNKLKKKQISLCHKYIQKMVAMNANAQHVLKYPHYAENNISKLLIML